MPYNGKDNDNYEGAQFYYHPDHLGSSSFITNLDGDVTQHIEYVPFGEVFIEERNNVWNTPYLFNAKELDEETGLYYYGARYYDSRISLWLSTDPLQEKYPNISSYVYTANNPMRFIDPDGRKIDMSSLSKSEKALYMVNIKLLNKHRLFRVYYNHLLSSEKTYFIKTGRGSGGGEGSFNSSTNEVHLNLQSSYVVSQELFHAFQSDLNIYSGLDLSVRETEGDLVSTNIAMFLIEFADIQFPSDSYYWDQNINNKYIDEDYIFNKSILSKDFEEDFNNAVNSRINFYKEREAEFGAKAPKSYVQKNSGSGAKALKILNR